MGLVGALASVTTEAPGGVKRRKVREGRNGERREAREPPSTAMTGFSRRKKVLKEGAIQQTCLLYTSPSPRDRG